MLVIRLSRKGRRNHPMYRIVVAEHTNPTDGKFVEVVGAYNPVAADQPLSVEKDRVEHWMSQGAKPSNTVARLLNKVGFDLPVIQKSKSPKKEAKKEEPAKAAGETKLEEVQAEESKEEPKSEETPVEEVKAEETTEEPKEEATEEPKKKDEPASEAAPEEEKPEENKEE